MKSLNTVAMVLLIVGGLNWGLVGIADFDLVTTLFGVGTMLTKVVYILVGLSALYSLTMFKNCCPSGGGKKAKK